MGVTIHKKEKQSMTILGLDISTKAGLAVVNCTEATNVLQHMRTLHFATAESKIKAPKDAPKVKKPRPYNQFARWQQYEDAFEAFLDVWAIDAAVVEGYGFASQSLSVIVEVSTHFKRVLHRRGIPWIEVKPTALKKFVTGKGVADKNVMLLEAYKRLGIDTKDDNQCDAACLAYLGAAVAGYALQLPVGHMEAVKGLSFPCN